MRALLLAATIAAAVVSAAGAAAQTPAAPTRAGDMFLSGEWRLPASHRYEVYSPERGEYQVVDVRQVPAIIQSGVPVYDRTTQVWIFHPTTGHNPMYLASSPAPAPTTAPGMPSGWQRIHGTVQSVQGPTLTLRADDGRTLTVDMTQVNPNVQRALTAGEGVEVIGHYAPPTNQQQVAARWIQQDSSNPARGGRIASPGAPAPAASPGPSTAAPGAAAPARPPGAKVDEKAWQRIHGTVQSISGKTLTLRAGDGRNIGVDMSKVNPNVQQGLTQGEKVTVIGHYEKDRNHVDAQFIQQERAGGAASPKTEPKKK